MDQRYKDLIQENYVELKRSTNAIDLVAHLWAHKAISDNDKEKIEKHAARQEQNVELYNAILTKGNHAFKTLVHAMALTEQGHLAKLLLITEEEGRCNSFTVQDVIPEEMANGNIRFQIRSTENLCVDQESHRIDADNDDNALQAKDPNNVQVKIEVMGFKCAPILGSLSGLDKVVKIKELVETVCGFGVNDQVLTYQNLTIQDTETIVNACRGSGTEISLWVVPRFIFTEPEQLSIEVVLADEASEPIQLKLSADDDIKKLKAKIKLCHPQNVPYYQLFLMFKGKECRDEHTVTECGITEGCTIYCQIRKDYFLLGITDTSSNTYFNLTVTGSLKIGDLLSSISQTRNVAATMCELFYRGKRLPVEQTLLETDRFDSLSKTGMKLWLVMPGMILIKVHNVKNDQYMDCYVHWDDKISSFKQEICELMNITRENHVLVYAGKTLEDEGLIHQYGINKNSDAVVLVIPSDHLVELSITILISDDLQPTHVLKVSPEATVTDLKMDISRKLLTLYPDVLVPDSRFYITVCRTEKTVEGSQTTIQSHGLKTGDKLTVIIQLESDSDSFFNMNISPAPSQCDSLYLPDKGLLKYLSDDESGISQQSGIHSDTDEPLSSVDTDAGFDDDSDHTPDVSNDTMKTASLNSTICDDHFDNVLQSLGLHAIPLKNEQGDLNPCQDKEETDFNCLQNKLGFDSSRIGKTVQADLNVSSTNNDENIKGVSNHLEENVKADSCLELNDFTTPTSSSQFPEVHPLHLRSDVAMSDVSSDDLSDVLKEDKTYKEYNTSHF